MTVHNKLIKLLKDNNIRYQYREHIPTLTSAESARVRGEALSSGAKAIVYKVQDEYCLFVMAADEKIDPKKIKKYFKDQGRRAKKTRFASVEELLELTHLVPGAVPPFGRPILDFELFVDPSLLINEYISFNAGSVEHSITMHIEDYKALAQPVILNFISKDL